MKCPYCAEEIKDEAIVCRHCGHDFSLVKPLLVRMVSLEKEVAALSAAPAPRSTEAPEAPAHSLVAFVVVALSVILTSGYLFISINPPPLARYPNLPKVLAIVLPPAVLGLVVGLVWNRHSLRSDVLSGFSLGFLNFIAIWLIINSFEGIAFKWALALFIFAFGQPLTFVAASLLGSSLRKRWPFLREKKPRGEKGTDSSEKVKLATVLDLLTKAVVLVGAILTTTTAVLKFFGGS